MASKHTRSRIIDTALQLFNESGTQAVSTNHVAKSMGISPGNLYYHFANKEEIIRAILDRMVEEMTTTWLVSKDRPPSLLDLRTMLTRIFALLWDYRFFQRELVTLLRRDPELKQTYRAIRQQRWHEMNGFFDALVEQNVLRRPSHPSTLPALIKMGWIISEHWLSYLEIEGRRIDPRSVREGIEVTIETMRPYLTNSALEELARFDEALPPEEPR